MKPRRLTELKFLGFTKGLMPSSEPNSGIDALIRSKNLINYIQPTKLTTRNNYYLKYETPIGSNPDIFQEQFIGFDNYFDKNGDEGIEITLYVTKGITKSNYTSLQLETTQVYARPYYTGSYWRDDWKNLTQVIISKVTVSDINEDEKYFKIAGNYGNLSQWRIINYTKNKFKPFAILKSINDGTDTKVLIQSYYDTPGFAVNDEVVLMPDYIPIETHRLNSQTITQEIEFVRATNKMIIGFGGKEGRRSLVVEKVKNYLNLNLSNFSLTQAQKDSFLITDRLVCEQCVTDYNYLSATFSFDNGDLPAGSYKVVSVTNYNGIELQVNNTQTVSIQANKKIKFSPFISLGYMSRRLKYFELFFNADLLNEKLTKSYEVTTDKDQTPKLWKSLKSEHIFLDESAGIVELHTESCATSQANANSIGQWKQNNGSTMTLPASLGVDAGDYYVESEGNYIGVDPDGFYSGELIYPCNSLAQPLLGNKSYSFTFNYLANCFSAEFFIRLKNNTVINIASFYGDNTWLTLTKTIQLPDEDFTDAVIGLSYYQGGAAVPYCGVKIKSMSITIASQLYFGLADLYGAELDTRLGYNGELVKDFGVSHVRNAVVFVSQAYIKERYPLLVFFNAINSDGANMQTIIPAINFLQIGDIFGKNIVGIGSAINTNLIVFTESSVNIVDPDSGTAIERSVGNGLATKRSLISIKGTIYYCGENDIMKISPQTGYQSIPVTSISLRKQYKNIKRKDLISACFDRFQTYRLTLSSSETDIDYRELVYADDYGFNELDRDHHPVLLINGMFGFVWFVAEDNNIYAEPFNIEEIIGYADVYGDYRSGW